MPIDRRWTRVHTAATIAVLGGLLVVLLAGKWAPWFTPEPPPPATPATIGNLVLRIDSKLIRAQILVEDLVYSEGKDKLAENTRAMDQVVTALRGDFDYLAQKVPKDNKSYLRVLARLGKWTKARDEVVELMKAGEAARAKAVVQTQCAVQMRKARDALAALEGFTQKRAQEFDDQTYRKREQNR
ncbi:MAG: MCP four helix bundle domain-containing protein [Desulfarculaceae bacterium]|nr:MCP four helix bundle domain-containing protein [Desulfarculaceae bacterium]MCF8072602.1 MCP four helix bundle domain-containing protein [Desulfarculaceae bacterium]MCF8103326.1 MCP four helix bundle domain-containing protein [Desulfarculaceae bacterium]MCF8118225.1 MCP four helix bundle domain-containing protein [Desulfarculaceae bacterium]